MTFTADLATAIPILTGAGIGIIQWLLNRSIGSIDATLKEIGVKVDNTNISLLQYQTTVAEKYVTKDDCTNCSAKDNN
jgi:hypothetical protein